MTFTQHTHHLSPFGEACGSRFPVSWPVSAAFGSPPWLRGCNAPCPIPRSPSTTAPSSAHAATKPARSESALSHGLHREVGTPKFFCQTHLVTFPGLTLSRRPRMNFCSSTFLTEGKLARSDHRNAHWTFYALPMSRSQHSTSNIKGPVPLRTCSCTRRTASVR
jgi:hypothetical protein